MYSYLFFICIKFRTADIQTVGLEVLVCLCALYVCAAPFSIYCSCLFHNCCSVSAWFLLPWLVLYNIFWFPVNWQKSKMLPSIDLIIALSSSMLLMLFSNTINLWASSFPFPRMVQECIAKHVFPKQFFSVEDSESFCPIKTEIKHHSVRFFWPISFRCIF